MIKATKSMNRSGIDERVINCSNQCFDGFGRG